MLDYLKTIPGVAWVALITVLIGWLEGDWFAGEVWVPGVVIVLTAVVQFIRVYADEAKGDRSLRVANRDQTPISRWFWGDLPK